jgi:quercetin 2,3-dioxygenase
MPTRSAPPRATAAATCQWLTAGRGVVHAEMFPLLDEDADNPLELFQIWLNLPARSKLCEPAFSMLWADQVPRATFVDGSGAKAELVVVAGRLAWPAPGGAPALDAPAPPPHSWARDAQSDLGIFTLALDPGARFTLPAARGAGTRRVAYFFAGDSLLVAGQAIGPQVAAELDATTPAALANPGGQRAELLVLQGQPLGEPVAQAGPFVMNTPQELRQAFADFERTRFGGWPWPTPAPVHGPDRTRFARPPLAAPGSPGSGR